LTTHHLFEGLVFKVATPAERDEVLHLRSELYTREFGNDGLDDLDEDAHHLIAINSKQRIVAALRVVDSDHRPFDLDHFVKLPPLDEDRVPAEVARFCVSPEYRQVRRDQFVHLGMFKLLYDFSNRNGITDLFTLGLPELRSVYRFAFFVARPEQCKHPIGNRRVQLMHLDLVDVRARYSHSRHPVARLLFQEPRANPVIAP
jgi:N-acyl-L-homoserine lactone synthetase